MARFMLARDGQKFLGSEIGRDCFDLLPLSGLPAPDEDYCPTISNKSVEAKIRKPYLRSSSRNWAESAWAKVLGVRRC